MKKYLLWAMVIIYLSIIFIASSGALPAQLSGVNDKVMHFIEFFILTLLLLIALKHSDTKYPYAIAVLAAIGFALLDEFHQLLVIGRTASVFDFIADSLGATTILLLKMKKK